MKQLPPVALPPRVTSLLPAFVMLHAPLLPAASVRAQSAVRRQQPEKSKCASPFQCSTNR